MIEADYEIYANIRMRVYLECYILNIKSFRDYSMQQETNIQCNDIPYRNIVLSSFDYIGNSTLSFEMNTIYLIDNK